MKPHSEELLHTILNTVKERLPPGLDDVAQDIRQNLQATLTDTLASMDMVTREEFDVQQKVLARTRQKLEALEQRANELETALKNTPIQN